MKVIATDIPDTEGKRRSPFSCTAKIRRRWPGLQDQSQLCGISEDRRTPCVWLYLPIRASGHRERGGRSCRGCCPFPRPRVEQTVGSISRWLGTATHPSYAAPVSVLAHNSIPCFHLYSKPRAVCLWSPHSPLLI